MRHPRGRTLTGSAALAVCLGLAGALAATGNAQDVCVPQSMDYEYCVVEETPDAVDSRIDSALNVADTVGRTVGGTTDPVTTGPDALVGGTVEKPYAAGAGCAYTGADLADSLTFHSERDAYDGACGRSSSGDGNTYYAGSPGSYTHVPAHGVSNGHVLRVFENAYRAGQWACADIWVNSRSNGMYDNTFHGLCGLQKGDLLFKGGYNRVGSSWCRAHPAGSSGEPTDPALGRCRYKYDG